MRKYLFLFMILFCFSAAFYAQSRLLVRPSDLRLVPETGTAFDDVTGYHLYVRKLPDVESIMLVETTKDPAGKEDKSWV